MYAYVYENDRVEWSEDDRNWRHTECKDIFDFYMLDGRLVYERIKGINKIEEG